nr:unnamed protein product [Callosobruchus chinensis]
MAWEDYSTVTEMISFTNTRFSLH